MRIDLSRYELESLIVNTDELIKNEMRNYLRYSLTKSVKMCRDFESFFNVKLLNANEQPNAELINNEVDNLVNDRYLEIIGLYNLEIYCSYFNHKEFNYYIFKRCIDRLKEFDIKDLIFLSKDLGIAFKSGEHIETLLKHFNKSK